MLQHNLPPAYVLDEMAAYEIQAIMEYSHYRNKESWEQTRLISYLIAQTHSKKKLKLEDIIKFSWDQSSDATAITTEEINRLYEQADKYEQLLAQQ